MSNFNKSIELNQDISGYLDSNDTIPVKVCDPTILEEIRKSSAEQTNTHGVIQCNSIGCFNKLKIKLNSNYTDINDFFCKECKTIYDFNR
jgi:hypothetical protein